MTRQRANESIENYAARLEDELDDAEREIESLENQAEDSHDHCERQRKDLEADAARHEWIREQLQELEQQIGSPSAPTTRGEMARLIVGLLRGEDWRNGTWRVRRRAA